MTAEQVFYQHDGEVTKGYYAELSKRGPLGQIAVALFRAQKRSSRAKDYKRGKYRRSAYDVKAWSMGELCRLLALHGDHLGFRWGWQPDPNVVFGDAPSWVLYVDLPSGEQVSFHNPSRMTGPEYRGKWDGVLGASERRIIRFCATVEGSVK